MEQSAQVTITDVQAEPKQGQYGPYTAYRVQTAQGVELFTTLDRVGMAAEMVRGQTVDAVYEIEPGGQRRDGGQYPPTYRLKNVLGGDMYAQPAQPAFPGLGATPQAMPQPQMPPAPAPYTPPAPPLPSQQPAAQAGPDQRTLEIMRQSALERAIRMSAAGIGPKPHDIFDLTATSDILVAYFIGGREKMASATRALEPVREKTEGAADGAGYPAAGSVGAYDPATAPIPWE